MLADGSVEAAKIMDMAENQNISQKTLNRAKSDLRAYSFKRGTCWYWEMPVETKFKEDSHDGQDSHIAMSPALTMINETEVI